MDSFPCIGIDNFGVECRVLVTDKPIMGGIFSSLSIFCGLLLFVKFRKSIYCNVKNTFVQDILQRHSNKKADFRMKVDLLAFPENRTKKGKREPSL